jgi:hypothetical protein
MFKNKTKPPQPVDLMWVCLFANVTWILFFQICKKLLKIQERLKITGMGWQSGSNGRALA